MIRFAKSPGSCWRVSYAWTTSALPLQPDAEKCLNSTAGRFVFTAPGEISANKAQSGLSSFWGGAKTKRNGFFTGFTGQSQEEARPHRSVARKDPSLLFAVPSSQKNVCGRASGSHSPASGNFSKLTLSASNHDNVWSQRHYGHGVSLVNTGTYSQEETNYASGSPSLTILIWSSRVLRPPSFSALPLSFSGRMS